MQYRPPKYEPGGGQMEIFHEEEPARAYHGLKRDDMTWLSLPAFPKSQNCF